MRSPQLACSLVVLLLAVAIAAVSAAGTTATEGRDGQVQSDLAVTLHAPEAVLDGLQAYAERISPTLGGPLRQWSQQVLLRMLAPLPARAIQEATTVQFGYDDVRTLPAVAADWIVLGTERPASVYRTLRERVGEHEKVSEQVVRLKSGELNVYAAHTGRHVVLARDLDRLHLLLQKAEAREADPDPRDQAGRAAVVLRFDGVRLAERFRDQLRAVALVLQQRLLAEGVPVSAEQAIAEFLTQLREVRIRFTVEPEQILATATFTAVAGSALEQFFRSLRNRALQELAELPTGAHFYTAFAADEEPVRRLLGPAVMSGGSAGGVLEDVLRSVEDRLAAVAVQRVASAYWFDPRVDARQYSILVTEEPEQLLGVMLDGWQKVAADQPTLARRFIAAIKIKREAFQVGGHEWHVVRIDWDYEAMKAVAGEDRAGLDFAFRLLGEAMCVGYAVDEGRLLEVVATGEAGLQSLIREQIRRPVGQDRLIQTTLARLDREAIFLTLADIDGSLAVALWPDGQGPPLPGPTAHSGLSLRTDDGRLVVRLCLPADGVRLVAGAIQAALRSAEVNR